MALYESYSRRFKLPTRGGGPLTHSPDARILTIVDDYDDRKAESDNLAPDKRISLYFEQFGCESYPYLRKRHLATLIKAPIRGTLQDWLANSDKFAGKWAYDSENNVIRVFHGDVNSEGCSAHADSRDGNGVTNSGDNGEALSGSNNIDGGDVSREGIDGPREVRLLDSIREPLTEALDLVHAKLERRAMTVQSAHDGTRRVRLLVRLGKLLFSAQGRTRLLKVPPFSAQRLEDYMNGNEDSEQQRLKLPLHRVFETHVPDSVCSRLEGIVLENAEVAFEESEKYDIQVVDTWSRTIYRAACKYVADEKRFIIKKVKKFPVRYGVIEIARPGNALDVRLILTIETRLTTLDDPLGAAFSKVLHSAQIDPQSPGGVRIPEDMIEGRRGFDVAARESDTSSTASEGSSGIRSSTYNDVSSGVSDVSSGISGMGSRFSIASNSSLNSTGGSSCSEGSGRFQVRAARHLTVRRVVAEGRVWKFSRVDGIEYKQGAGRKTNMVEVFPAAWQQQLKGDSRGRERSKEQQPPTWSSEQIIGECPGLLAWLSVNLP